MPRWLNGWVWIKEGFYRGSQRHRNEVPHEQVACQADLCALCFQKRETAEHYARLFVQLKTRRVPNNDLWIAALALEHDLLLITRDQHFQHIHQLLCG